MGRRQRKISVTLACSPIRPIQLRYFCPLTKRHIRISTGTYDVREAEKLRRKREAELLEGTYVDPLEITWLDFQDRYDSQELAHLRPKTRDKANTVMAAVTAIVNPGYLSDLNAQNLVRFRAEFAAGAFRRGSKPSSPLRPRSPHTVKSYMTAIISILNWAERMGYVSSVPKLPRYKAAAKTKAMKGRPFSLEEFERMLKATSQIVGKEAARSWRYLLRGLWESALRLDEAMHLSWDIPDTIQPEWRRGRLPVLLIPAHQQKNNEEDEIPLLPWLERILLKTPPERRTGWVFNPSSLNLRLGRRPAETRPNAEWVGKVISRIGEAARVIVEPANTRLGRKVKYASAHDIRRSCAERLEVAGVDPMLIARVMRHKSFDTTRKHYRKGDVQREAAKLRTVLGTVAGTSGRPVDITP